MRRVFAAFARFTHFPNFAAFARRARFVGGLAGVVRALGIGLTVHAPAVVDAALLADARLVFVEFQRLNLDFCLDQLFNVSHQALVAAGNKAHRQTRSARAAGAADAVYVVFGVERHVEVEHRRHVLDVQPSRCHVGADQQIDLALLESLKRF